MKLSFDDRRNLSTENLICKRYLSVFALIASESARHLNKQFTGKRIRDDLMFSEEEEESLVPFHPASHEHVFRLLDGMEKRWTDEQMLARKEKLKIWRRAREKERYLVSSCAAASFTMVC